jgi:DNA-binding transcriptional LysR family regulator
MANYPELRLELTLNDRRIDPLEEGFDVTVRIGELADSSLIARRVAVSRLRMVASPGFLQRHGRPDSLEAVAALPWLTYGQAGGQHRVTLGRGEGARTYAVASVVCANNGEVLREAAVAGLGVTMLPGFIAGPRLRDGALVELLPEASPPDLPIHALYAPNRYLAAKTRLFIDFLAARFGRPDWESH